MILDIVKQVVEPVNTTRKGRAFSFAKQVLLDPEEYLQALDQAAELKLLEYFSSHLLLVPAIPYFFDKYLRISNATAAIIISPLIINCQFGFTPIKVRP